MSADEQFIRRAIRLAMNGRGSVEPNPMVGCVIVKDGRVIGEGFHAKYGGPHAEPTALARCTESPAGATAYVTLEPCCHTDKRTPPCAPRLIHEKIARVVVGCLDPNPLVNGKGVRHLRKAGVAVAGPVLGPECRQLISPFVKRVADGRPYLTMKWAESANGKVAGPAGRRVQISNAAASRVVQRLRGRSDGIVVGISTVLNDDPTLLPRDVPTPAVYDRIVLDSRLRLPIDSQLVRTATASPVLAVATAGHGLDHRATALERHGVVVHKHLTANGNGRLSVVSWLGGLPPGRYSHLLVEPGPTLAQTMFPYADRVWVIRSPTTIEDDTAPRSAAVPEWFVPVGRLDLDGDVLTEYLNTRSPAYSAAAASADLVLSGASSALGTNLAPGEHGRG